MFTDEFLDAIADRIADRLAARIGHAPTTGLLTVEQAAQRLGMTKWAVYQMIHRKELATVRHGRRVRIEATAITEYIDRGRVA